MPNFYNHSHLVALCKKIRPLLSPKGISYNWLILAELFFECLIGFQLDMTKILKGSILLY